MKRSVGVVILLAGILVAASFTTIVRPLNLYNTDPNKMQVDKKVWNGTEWVDEVIADIGDIVKFRISIYQPPQNDPNVYYDLYDITVRDELPDGLVYIENTSIFYGDAYIDCSSTEPSISGNTLLWDLFTNDCWVLVGEDQHFYIEFEAEVTGGGELTNLVNVSAKHCSDSSLILYSEAIANITVPQPSPGIEVEKLVKTGCGEFNNSVQTSVGSEVTFKIVVSNTGDTGFDNVTVVDTLPSGLSYVEGTAQPNISVQDGNKLIWYFNNLSIDDFPIVILFNATVDSCGIKENIVNVTALYDCYPELTAQDNASVEVLCNPGISLIKKVSLDGENWTDSLVEYLPNVIHAGNKIYFKINVTNIGNINLTCLLEDFLPPFLKYNYDSNIPPTFANDSYINWSDGLGVGESLEIIFSTTPLSGGEGINFAEATADQGVSANDSVDITLYEPSIEVNKTVRRLCPRTPWGELTEASPGQIVEFYINITYHGNPLDPLNYVLHNITIIDQLPPVLKYIENSSIFKGDWSDWDEYYTGDLEPTVDEITNTLTWDLDDIFRIPDGGTLSLRFKTIVKDNAPCGIFENVVTVEGEECSGIHLNDSDNASVKIPCPEVIIEKKIKDPGTGEWAEKAYVYYGDKITFDIAVVNVGEREVCNITVGDPLPSEESYKLEFISANPEPTSIVDNTLIWEDICVGAKEEFHIEITTRFTGENCYGCYNNTAYMMYYIGCEQIEKNNSATFCIVNDGYAPFSHVNKISPYWHNSGFVITATAWDNETKVTRVELFYSYSEDNETWSEWISFGNDTDGSDGWSWEFFKADGYYRFCSIAYDAVGNREEKDYTEEAAAGIDTVPPASSVNPIVPYEQNETPISLDWTASDDLSGVGEVILYYRHSIDNVTWSDWKEGDWLFEAPEGNGYYEFYSIAIDKAGNVEAMPSEADARCKVTLPGPLEAMIVSAPSEGLVGHDLTFEGGVTGGYPPYTFYWDFGDGSTAEGKIVTHKYLTPGNFTVTLKVVDGKGDNDTDTTTVTVHPLEELKVNITKPVAGGIYFKDRKIISLPFLKRAIVIGYITVEAEVENAYGDVAVNFSIDGETKETDEIEPYNYTWNEKAFGIHTIEVTAYDHFNDLPVRSANATVDVWIFCLGLGGEKPGVVKGKVYDASKPIRKPGIGGVNVSVVGTNISTETGRFLWKKGKFCLKLEPGEYTLRFEKTGYETKEIHITVNASEVVRLNVPLNKTEPGYLKGKVYDNSTLLKRGLAGAEIRVIETNETFYSKRFPKGRYSIKLDPGVYHIEFKKEGYATKTIVVRINASEVTKENVGLDRIETGIVYGRVIESGKIICKGIRGAEIEFVNNETGEHFNTTSGFRGKYSKELPAGEYTVYVDAGEDYKCLTDYVTVEPNKRTRKNLELERAEN